MIDLKSKQAAKGKESVWQATDIFFKNEDAKTPIVINRGGAGSSKSHSLAQLIAKRFINESGKKFLVLRKTLPSLKLSVLLLFNEILSKAGILPYVKIEKVTLNYRYNMSLLHFGSLDDPEKMKSTEWNYIWMEEATEFTEHDYKTIKLRLRARSTDRKQNQIFLSFNPVDEQHWIKRLIDSAKPGDITEIVSTYRDNLFLMSEYKNDLEALIEVDQNFHRVYALGEWGRLTNIIYSNWQVTHEWPEGKGGETFYGLDFGYNNPSSLIQVTVVDDIFYLRELIYQNKLTNHDLIEKMKLLLPLNHRRFCVYADVAEPDRIQEIYRAGFNILDSDKNVKDGIDFVRRKTLRIHVDSVNVRREISGYSYKEDRAKVILDEPVKYNDHAMDAIRYAIYTHMGKRTTFNPKGILFGNSKRITSLMKGY